MRTDLTLLCAHCGVRLPRVKRCPRCKRIRLFDLRTAEGRAGALTALAKRAGTDGPSQLELRIWRWVRRVVPMIGFASAFVAYLWTGSGQAAIVVALATFVVLLAIALVVFAAYGVGSTLLEFASVVQRFVRKRPTHADLPRLLIAGSPPLDDAPDRFTGRVRVLAHATSPLARKACAAYRVVGEGPLGPVDDGGGTTFEVVSDDGSARVVLGAAALDIPVPSAPVTMRPDAELARFLEQRGVFPDRGPVRLAEGLLEDGDHVEVIGRSTKTTETDGYRGQKDVAVFSEHADAPLLIRKIRDR